MIPLKDMRAHWTEWRSEWERKLAQNEIQFLRAVADLSSSVDVYGLAASDVYGMGGADLTAIVNSARRRNRSLWEVVEELVRQPGLLRLSPETRAALEKLVADGKLGMKSGEGFQRWTPEQQTSLRSRVLCYLKALEDQGI